ncbi:prepilin peptidase, partial [Saccharothrix longispora]|uniref:prepilin peptidase n=1 Tax=Saccharothrix longispora TaxID=33920 RepID=UPI0028FDBD2C
HPTLPHPHVRTASPTTGDATGLGTRDLLATSLTLAAAFTLLHHRLAGTTHLTAVLWLAATGTPLMITDWTCHRLPTHLVTATFCGGIALLGLTAATTNQTAALGRALAASAAVSAIALTVALAAPHALGAGDVRLLGAVAPYLGWVGWSQVIRGAVLALLLAATAGTVLLAAGRLARGDPLAFGPAVIGGALLSLVLP